jgi:hypothetical protein
MKKHVEIGVLRSRCLDRRIATHLVSEIAAWERLRAPGYCDRLFQLIATGRSD